jgi:hypothetical protein
MFELPANRYDLLSAEGLALAISSYIGIGAIPKYVCNKGLV